MRRPDWMQQLINAVETAKLIPFQYGMHDCCLWAAYCVDQMCDTQYARAVLERFNYRDEGSANAVIESGGGLGNLVTEFLGEPVPAQYAAPGDVVLVNNAGRWMLAVMVGHSFVAPSEAGLVTLPFSSGVSCWKV